MPDMKLPSYFYGDEAMQFIQPDPSIYPPAPGGRQMGIDRYELREEVKENIITI